MALQALTSHLIFQTVLHFAGEEVDDTMGLYTELVDAGGQFAPMSDPNIAAGAAACASARLRGSNEIEIDEIMMSFVATYTASLGTGSVQPTRTIATTAPLAGGGTLAANRTLTIAAATSSLPGSQSAADKKFQDSQRAHSVALIDADESLAVGGGYFYTQAVALGANRVKTLATTGAVDGDEIIIVRTDAAAHTLTVANGGGGAGNLFVMAASVLGCMKARYDGTNWVLVSFGVQ